MSSGIKPSLAFMLNKRESNVKTPRESWPSITYIGRFSILKNTGSEFQGLWSLKEGGARSAAWGWEGKPPPPDR